MQELLTRAVARELNYFTTICCLQCCFQELAVLAVLYRPHVTKPAQDLHIRLHLHNCLRSATSTADATVGLYNQRISENQTVRNISGKLTCMLASFTRVLTWLQFVVVTWLRKCSLSVESGTLEKCSSRMNPCFYCTRWMAAIVCGFVGASGL